MNLTAPDPALMTWKLKGADQTASFYVRVYKRSLYAKCISFRLPSFYSYSVFCTGVGPEDRGAGARARDPDDARGAVGRPLSSGTGGLGLFSEGRYRSSRCHILVQTMLHSNIFYCTVHQVYEKDQLALPTPDPEFLTWKVKGADTTASFYVRRLT